MILKTNKIFIFLLSFLAISCVKEPGSPVQQNYSELRKDGVFILCEGVWGLDNSSIARYNLANRTLIPDFFSASNEGMILGDLANDIVIKGDTAFVAVTSAMTIEKFLVSSGKSFGRLILSGRRAPRKLLIYDDKNAYVTDLYSHSVIHFNPLLMKYIDEIPVGPAPEAIASDGIYLYVANSGYGDYLKTHPKAGTISVIDVLSEKEIRNFYAGPNVTELLINRKRNSIFAAYRNVPSAKNETGGVVEFSLSELKEKKRWSVNTLRIAFTNSSDTLLILNDTCLVYVDLIANDKIVNTLISNPKPNEKWYSVAVAPDNSIWIGNAKNYQINGELLIYSHFIKEQLFNPIPLGVNPGKILFY